MKAHPGKTTKMFMKKALPRAATPLNIQKGFEITDIYPFNRNIFSDEKFLPYYITDHPMSSSVNDGVENAHKVATGVSSTNCEPVPGPSGLDISPNMLKSPELPQPFPKVCSGKKVGG